MTEVLHADSTRFPRAKVIVTKGPDKGREVLLEGQTIVIGTDATCELQLNDSSVSRRHFELSGGPGGYRLRDLRSTNGVFVEGIAVMDARLSDKARLAVGRTELRFEPQRQEVQWPLSPHERFGDVHGKSVVMRRLFALLERAALSELPIVIEGDAGTGKEALARGVHEKSVRREGPFVAVDVGASSETLIDSDLFGHDVSSSKPVIRPGAFEEAEGGTLYLNEVAELSNALQAKLLRVLESGEVKRPAGQAPAKVNARVIVSTQKNLETLVKAGQFREDLFFKLSVFRVRVPNLRERSDDIELLIKVFEQRAKSGTPLSQDTIDMLTRHDWPGNVRELRNALERLAAFPDVASAAITGSLGTSDETPGQPKIKTDVSAQLLSLPYHEAKERVLDSFERSYLLEHLKAAGNVVTRAAQRTGLPRQSFHRMLRRLGVGSDDES
jgi:two-component system, NtrC family, response regulator GlrR